MGKKVKKKKVGHIGKQGLFIKRRFYISCEKKSNLLVDFKVNLNTTQTYTIVFMASPLKCLEFHNYFIFRK